MNQVPVPMILPPFPLTYTRDAAPCPTFLGWTAEAVGGAADGISGGRDGIIPHTLWSRTRARIVKVRC